MKVPRYHVFRASETKARRGLNRLKNYGKNPKASLGQPGPVIFSFETYPALTSLDRSTTQAHQHRKIA
jgi:hypothetical protein